MKCAEFREAVGAEPNSSRVDVAAHVAQCPACARYRRELQQMDRAIYGALNVDVAAAAPKHSAMRRRPAWSLAAGVVATVSVAVWLLTGRESFAEQIVEHVQGEPKSLTQTSASLSSAELEKVLSRSGVRLKPGAAHVSYAMSCWFRGHFVPHLVVQTDAGPVTVLVMPKERPLSNAERIDEAGFAGVVLPAPRGVLVVLGQDVAVEGVAASVASALEYTN
jgi:hypothetical protein